MKLAFCNRGDRVRLGARVFELAWPMPNQPDAWFKSEKLRPEGYFAREIIDGFDGEERLDLTWLDGALEVERVHEFVSRPGAAGGEVDPLRGARRGTLL